MLLAVDFHDQFALLAGEVRDERTDRKLSPKFQALQLAIAKGLPKFLFRFAWCFSHSAGEVGESIDSTVPWHGLPSP